ncbi:MAG: hypothetical protein A2X25_08265 [Chloroflexi bacterium GWB2_49_20]|nr:MAG: hypothetical protein A2X25_08265 [Chloroflexi bacterium GWB2_49_20]OGN79570.1 MAG: hypothetical protein A2X26_05760 [Chloroflexi bacterium GWC2_49_37]OGN84507.1 MAG: hypothetical protein A2X27_10770 [Chloroflexi bacterium GWD2_49_16]HBG74070.1 hypothetical protein [Anaerolineae bacterium]HCC78872.1 hypothetical protein [Anaerolineae bacterium]
MTPSELPEEFSSMAGFGELVNFFPARKIKFWLPVIYGTVFLIISLASFLFGITMSSQEIRQHGTIVVGSLLFWPGIIALTAFLLAVWMAWLAYTRWGLSAAVYQNGFAFNNRKGLHTWFWQDVVSLYMAVTRHYTNGIYSGTTHVYSIVNKNGKCLVLNDVINKVEEMAGLIEEYIYSGLYSQASQSYNSGKKLAFGNVILDAGGIGIGKKEYAWNQVERVFLRQGVLHIVRKDGSFFKNARVRVAAIPNFRVLISILEQGCGVSNCHEVKISR